MRSANTKGGQNKAGFTVCTADASATSRKYSNNAAASHAHESELWLALYTTACLAKSIPLTACASAGCRFAPFLFRPVNLNETKGAGMSGEKYFHIDPETAKPDR